MSLLLRFGAFWYDFLVGDAWDIAAGVVVSLAAGWLLIAVVPGADVLVGPLIALAIIVLTGVSLAREVRTS